MLKYFKDILGSIDSPVNEYEKNKSTKIAACAVFLEAANADENFSKDENNLIMGILNSTFGLGEDEIANLMKLADERIKSSVSLYEFTDQINRSLSKDEKYELLKDIWKILLADNYLDKYEDHFIRRLTGNLNMAHSDMIAAKMEVKAGMKK